MNSKRTMLQGKMNKDIDNRLLPDGQYRDALNVRLSSSEGSDVGAIENCLGNEKLSDLSLTNATTLGAYGDSSNQLIYWFVTSDEKDAILEYNISTDTVATVLESSTPGVLNFSTDYLINDIDKVYNGDSSKDMLFWTDNYNPPRKINITRAKTYGLDGFVEDDISVIKKPPRFAPTTTFTYTTSTEENNLKDKFLAFSYRYKYLDGEYSAISSFSNYMFSPSDFDLDWQTFQNEGMVNVFNAVDIDFNTGSERVTDIQLLYKESNSNTIYLIETFNKEDKGWSDDATETFTFANSKKYTTLPTDEIFRHYDNVPRLVKTQELIGNRLGYANYLEGYNLKDSSGEDVNVNYTVNLLSTELIGEELTTSYNTINVADDEIEIDFTGIDLDAGYRLSFYFELEEITNGDGDYSNLFEFILNEDYADADALATSDEFILFVETIMSNHFEDNYTATPPTDGTFASSTGFVITSSDANTIQIQTPVITYDIDNGVDPVYQEDSEWDYNASSYVTLREQSTVASLKSNRSYEIGIIYMDAYGRSTTVQTCETNSIFIPTENSITQNILEIVVDNNPPEWADRYKIVVKENKGIYYNVFAIEFYNDGIYKWVKLEGENKNKVKEGDTLIVKSDLNGAVLEDVRIRVIDVVSQDGDFLTDNTDENGNEIIESAGLYMKIKPKGFDMTASVDTFQTYAEDDAVKSGFPEVYLGTSQYGTLVGYYDSNTSQYVDSEITPGSRIKFFFRNYESDGYNKIYEKEFIVQDTYSNFEDWFDAEVVDLGASETDFTWNFVRNGSNNSLKMYVRGNESGATFERSKLQAFIDVQLTDGLVVFETEPEDLESEIFYETTQTFEITSDLHQANGQNQNLTPQTSGSLVVGKTYKIETFESGDDFTNVGASSNATGVVFKATGTTPTTWTNSSSLVQPAVIELDFFNCYIMGSGIESYQYKDGYNKKYLNIDFKPTSTSIERYSEVRRFADITYSEPYSENTNINGLNEFNLSKANYKDDIDKQFGAIQKIYSRDTDLLVAQEDKWSYVMYGKDLLMNADGTSNVSSIEDVLGQQVPYTGEYGLSKSPESFAFFGTRVYGNDTKRGTPLRLSVDGLTELSMYGMVDFFRDAFRGNEFSVYQGAYDPHNDEYILCVTNNEETFTIGFKEGVKGWVSRYSYVPERMLGLNNSFYSFKDGELYLHDSENVARNNFYGEQFTSKVTVVFNDVPSDDKIFKTFVLESDAAWDVTLSTNYTNGVINASEFTSKESRWFAYIRKNENASDLNSSAQGIGTITASSGLTVTVENVPSNVSYGDTLYQINGSSQEVVGVIDSISNNVITLVSLTNTPINSAFAFSKKDARIEGSEIRGYYLEAELENDSTNAVELFAVNTNLVKSYV